MNLYEAIFLRRSVKQFRMESLERSVLSDIAEFYEGITPLFPGIRTEIGITENSGGGRVLKGLFGIQAPYYLSIYSEKRDRAEMNAGYICQQICLYMMTRGIGSCYLGSVRLIDAPLERDGLHFVILVAFGRPLGALIRRQKDAKRLSVRELTVCKEPPKRWMTQVIEAARLAPSSLNQQPWRFVVAARGIHIFSRKGNMARPKRWDEFNFGVMLAHIAVASEELWLDVDLIRLENISQKSFKSSQYVLSAIARVQEDGKNLSGRA